MGFPATESGPFGPARFLAGFGENERNVAPLPAVSACWCDLISPDLPRASHGTAASRVCFWSALGLGLS